MSRHHCGPPQTLPLMPSAASLPLSPPSSLAPTRRYRPQRTALSPLRTSVPPRQICLPPRCVLPLPPIQDQFFTLRSVMKLTVHRIGSASTPSCFVRFASKTLLALLKADWTSDRTVPVTCFPPPLPKDFQNARADSASTPEPSGPHQLFEHVETGRFRRDRMRHRVRICARRLRESLAQQGGGRTISRQCLGKPAPPPPHHVRAQAAPRSARECNQHQRPR